MGITAYMMTTCLSDSEQNRPLKNKVISEVLQQVRELTGENWQVVENEFTSKRLFRKPVTSFSYELYVEVGGCMPFMCINFYRSDSESSINPRNNADLVVAYLYGMLGGLNFKKEL